MPPGIAVCAGQATEADRGGGQRAGSGQPGLEFLSKEKLSLAMSISTSNEHILDKTMVKICGLTICLISVSVQWLTC